MNPLFFLVQELWTCIMTVFVSFLGLQRSIKSFRDAND